MSTHIIKVPDLGEGIAEVELVAWHVAPGDAVREDQPLADVMTDKANVEIPSPVTGTVVSLGGQPGQVLAVGSDLIHIDTADAGGQAGVSGPDRTTEPEAPVSPRTARTGSAPEALQTPDIPDVPHAAEAPDASPSALPPETARSSEQAAGAGAGRAVPLASPAVRRHARELGVELRAVAGSGPGGRVLHEDVIAFASGMAGEPETGSQEGRARAIQDNEAVPADEEPASGVRAIALTGLRRRIAERMQASLRIPHFTYVEEVDVTEVETLRARLNERFGSERGHLGLLPFILRAVVLAVSRFPRMNARFDDEAGVITQFAAVHAGVATHTPNGLVVPVLRDAHARDLWDIAAGIAQAAALARTGKATREQLSGSTITVTSLGALGGIVSTPVINQPEVAIVGVNRVVLRPACLDGAMVPRKLMNLSSSFDHRVIDGMPAAEFVQEIRRLLECPALLFVD